MGVRRPGRRRRGPPSDEPFVILGEYNAPALDPIAWYGGNSGVDYVPSVDCSDTPEMQLPAERCGSHPVALKEPNRLGLYDVIGNAEEWVWDIYARNYGGIDDPGRPVADPLGPWERPPDRPEMERVRKGCGWHYTARWCRLAARSAGPPGITSSASLRPVRTLLP